MLLWLTFFLGVAFGVAARLGRFCLLRGLRQSLGLDGAEPRGSAPALQAFALAVAVALLASQGLQWAGLVDLGKARSCDPTSPSPGFSSAAPCLRWAWCWPMPAARARWCCWPAATCAPS